MRHEEISALTGAQVTLADSKLPAARPCRANSLRGRTNAAKPSYPPVQSVSRALKILKVLNRARIASVGDIHKATGLPKSTIVRMLDTLIADGYVARDNMCGGYHVTRMVRELDAGYEGIAELIEVARPFAIDLTTKIKWPVAMATFDEDAMAIHFWTGTISPWVHANTLVGNRPNLLTSAMGRAYMAFCPGPELEKIIAKLRARPDKSFNDEEEARLRSLLEHVREKGYALRAPNTEPKRNTTIAMPVLQKEGPPLASITVSFFTSAVPSRNVAEQIIQPLRERVSKIEAVMAYLHDERTRSDAMKDRGAYPLDSLFERQDAETIC